MDGDVGTNENNDEQANGHEVPSELSAEFDAAFAELAAARIAYEDDPRDPDRIARLGAARDRLEAARTAIDAVRAEMGEVSSENPERPFSKVDGEGMGLWQSIQHQA